MLLLYLWNSTLKLNAQTPKANRYLHSSRLTPLKLCPSLLSVAEASLWEASDTQIQDPLYLLQTHNSLPISVTDDLSQIHRREVFRSFRSFRSFRQHQGFRGLDSNLTV
jgi:hypothetical protein